MSAPIKPATSESIEEAAAILRAGGLVAMPTETVYGLAADASNSDAITRLYEVKGRPRFNPLIAHVTGPRMARTVAEWPELGSKLAGAFWPGPLTLVLPKKPGAAIADIANAGLDSLALRAPAHPAARTLLSVFGSPLVAPSANLSGTISPTTAAHVAESLGEAVDLILDGGTCTIGVESTVIAIDEDKAVLFRPGGLDRAQIEAIAGPLGTPDEAAAPASPGMLKSHYAPNAAMRLNVTEKQPGELLLGFGDIGGDLNLSAEGDLAEAAKRLFSGLRELDARKPDRIAVAPVPEQGLGEAINDRLQRAAAPKD
ncbi:L-threonylcarbamoyladenylate synthase [Maricaulis sp.]|uniref:L-threonylcarbamoyladenylate synthase n=1 Tax=Maricaulis sp. TaxID=1486257 RepID=UPI0026220F99|nr:L-threonylcarbamoyladenylate synthase [Maricaulis sp.]